MKKDRKNIIDFLRAIAIFLMIFLHTSAYYLGQKYVRLVWDMSHFVVPILVFCSGYIFFSTFLNKTDFNFLLYIKKRFIRLLTPYYIFLFLFFIVIFFTQPKKLSPIFIKNSLFLTGAIDLTWFVLLFLYMAVILPILLRFIQKKPILFYIYSLISFTSTIMLLFFTPKTNYLYYMWLPWSLVLIYSYFYLINEKRKKFFYINIAFGLFLFISSLLINLSLNKSIILFNNKYPPNIYYLSYGLTIIGVVSVFFDSIWKKIKIAKDFFYFLSKNSYPLFFIHWIVLYFFDINKMQFRINFITFFSLIFFMSLTIQYLINYRRQL